MTRTSRTLVPPLALLLLALARPALADQRADARRHFRDGMSLISAGHYDDGIAELKQAYAIKPHPAVLFNIGKAYQDAGRLTDAIDAFEQYLSYEPQDADDVRTRIANLQKLIPPEPTPQPEPTTQPAPVKNAAVDDASKKRMDELLTRLDAAVNKAEKLNVTPVAEPAPKPAAETSAPVNSSETQEDLAQNQGDAYEEVVVTASRYAQNALQAPAATTTITADEIALSGATSLPELLRRVPGVDVMRLGVGSADVSIRGFNQRVANKLLVLVDGRSVYEDFLGLTIYDELPIQLDEIERIEIIRGPGSALYGANAFVGVVNIITKHPGVGSAAIAKVGGGSGNQGLGEFIASGRNGRFSYRLSGGYQQADKWSVDFDPTRADYTPQVDNPNLALQTTKANGVAAVRLSHDAEISVAAGVNKYFTEIYPLGLLRNDALDATHLYNQANLDAGPFQVRIFWNHLQGGATPQYQAVGQRSLATSLVSNVLDADTQLEQGFHLGGEHRITMGAGYRLKAERWDYLSQNPVEHHFSAFIQEEYRPIQQLAITGSLRADRHPLLDDGKPGFAISPRGSAVYQVTDGQAVHASVGTAFREPTFVESYTQLLVPVPGQPNTAVLTVGNPALKPENVFSMELGYRVELSSAQFYITGYRNQVKNLIELSPLATTPAGASYDGASNEFVAGQSQFINDTPVYTALGGEFGAKLFPVDRLGLRGSFAAESITATGIDASHCGPCQEVPAVKLYLGASYRTDFHLDLNVDGSYVSSTTWIERAPDPSNLTEIAFTAFPLGAYADVNARVAYRFFDDHLEAAVIGQNLAAAHQEHPFGNELETRVLATLGGSL